jgi:mannose-6-phosphate isomerase-like protein (cupin superfamily)
MSVPPFETARVSELDAIPVTETLVWRPVRRRFGIEAFGVNAYTAEHAGDEIVEDHTEETYRHQELYFVVEGRATFTVGGEEIDAPAGTFVSIRDPATRRHAVAREPGSTVLAIGGRPREPFEESGWEYSLPARPFAAAGDYERAAEVASEGLARAPNDAGLVYDVGCWEALAGRREDALAHLRRAFELAPEKVREWAANDTDLDSIRDDPRFPPAGPRGES